MSLFNNLGGGDIWGSNGFLFTSPINDILDKENFTLTELLQEDEIIQEVKSLNTKLVDFLSQEDTIGNLIEYITVKPANDDDESRKLRYPYMACEVLCCETPEILEAICSSRSRRAEVSEDSSSETASQEEREDLIQYPYLDKLFDFLNQNQPLDHRLAGYFEKAITTLLRHRCMSIVGYINKQGTELFHRFARHVGNYSISLIIKRLLLPKYACVEAELLFWEVDHDGGRSGVNLWCRWSQWKEVLPCLLDQLRSPAAIDDMSTCQHVAEIFLSLVEQPSLESKLLERLTDADMIQMLLDHTIPDTVADSSAANQAMTAAARILRSLVLRFASPLEVVSLPMMGLSLLPSMTSNNLASATNATPVDPSDQPLTLTPRKPPQHLLDALRCKIPKMCQWIKGHEQDSSTVIVQTKQAIPKLGPLRLELVRLLDAVMRLGDDDIDKCFEEEEALALMLELFFKFEMNNTLHHAITSIVTRVLEGPANMQEQNEKRETLIRQLFDKKCRIISRILEANELNKVIKSGPEQRRLSYMGHITIMSQSIVSQTNPSKAQPNKPSLVATLVAESESATEWEAYALGDLQRRTTVQSAPLGGFHVPSRFEEHVLTTDFSEDVLSEMDDTIGLSASLSGELKRLDLSPEEGGPLMMDDDVELNKSEKSNDKMDKDPFCSPPTEWKPFDATSQSEAPTFETGSGWANFANFDSLEQEDFANFEGGSDGIAVSEIQAGIEDSP